MTSAPPSASVVEITRVLRAPRARVYAAWTDPDQMQWWGPEGCETLEFTADLRVGGKWTWRLRTPDGEMTARGEYRELRPDERVAYTWQWADDPDWENVESLVTVELRDHPEGTELRLRHAGFPSAESRENHVGGWTEALGKLERQLTA